MAGYSCIGLDIGSNLIKLVQLKGSGAGSPLPLRRRSNAKGTMQAGSSAIRKRLPEPLPGLRLAQPWHWNRVILAPPPAT